MIFLQEAFVQAAQLSSADSKIYSLNLLCLLLPPSHLSVFRYVLEILSDVSSNWQVMSTVMSFPLFNWFFIC